MAGHDCNPAAREPARTIRSTLLFHFRPVSGLAAAELYVYPRQLLAPFLQHVRPIYVRRHDGTCARQPALPFLLYFVRSGRCPGAGGCIRTDDQPLRLRFRRSGVRHHAAAPQQRTSSGSLEHRRGSQRPRRGPYIQPLSYAYHRSLGRHLRHSSRFRIHVSQRAPLSALPSHSDACTRIRTALCRT